MLTLGDAKPSIGDRFLARAAAWPVCRSPFGVLLRAFVEQFFSSDLVTSDMRLRQSIIGVLAFLLTPGVLMMTGGLTELQVIAYRARLLHASGMLEPVLAYLAAILIAYSMVTVGFIAVLEWDSLSFDRRDAMVFGPLPVTAAAIISAKLAALGGLLVVVAASINLMPTLMYALTAGGLFGPIAFVRYLSAYMMGTIGGAIFVFAAIVTVRGAVALVGGPRLAFRIGSLLQFLFVGVILTFLFLIVTSGAKQARMLFFDAGGADWLPSGWFLALFERVRGATDPDLVARANRAIVGTALALAGAVVVTIAGFRRQSQLALAPSSSVGTLAQVWVGRALARAMTAGDRVAQATADFILETLARRRAQQELIAINTALGAAVVIAGLARGSRDLSSLTRPRTAILWIPFVLAYWMTVGLRASFFVPAELPASWTFRLNGPATRAAYWRAVRASMIAFVVPRVALIAAAILVPLLGWRIAAIQMLGLAAVVSLLIEVVALTIDFVPFTRPYRPGHANLRTLWWLYLFGFLASTYWPARVALASVQDPRPLAEMAGWSALGIAFVEIVARFWTGGRSIDRQEEPDDLSTITVLDLSAPVRDSPLG